MIALDATHDPALTSWLETANGHPEFPIQNLPLGIFSPPDADRRPGVAIGDRILDLAALAAERLIPEGCGSAMPGDTLNDLLALPPGELTALRRCLSELLSDAAHRDRVQPHLHQAATCELHLPARVGDYTDFYVGIHHATNVGRLFRPHTPLLPNYVYVPIGYHGRASSIRPSGIPVRRPRGQLKFPDATSPVFVPVRRLDYELELGLWIGRGNALGEPIPIGEAPVHMAGLCLINDWSARDVQAWEYQPLGPFLAKNFHTTISPWIVTMDALAPYRRPAPARPAVDGAPLPYLDNEQDRRTGGLALRLEVSILSARMREQGLAPLRLSRGDTGGMYWTLAQILTHHASNGCNLSPGDLLGTGTLSTMERDGFGSLLEITAGGTNPVYLPSGETRTFVEDGDEILLSCIAHAERRPPIGFGACRAIILPAA